MLSLTEVTGYAAAAVGTVLMLPQVIKAWRSKRMHDVSLWTVILYLVNCALWLSYGLLLEKPPLIAANGIGLTISVIQLGLKARYGGKP
jgi:MtN3 and saliva related transmembrane protein